MSALKKLFDGLLAIISGYSRLGLRMAYLEEAVRHSDLQVERSLKVINDEMGSMDRRMSHIAEDMAYLRGRLGLEDIRA